MIDTDALRDRLYADALAADLRVRRRFVEAKTKVIWDDIEPHVRDRAEAHAEGLVPATSVDGRPIRPCSGGMESAVAV